MVRRIISLMVTAMIASSSLSFAQTLLDDADGRTAILGDPVGVFTVNVADTSIQLSHLRMTNADREWIFGGRLKGKSTEGTAALFDGDFSPGLAADAFIGYKLDTTRVVLRTGYQRERLRLIDAALPYSEQIQKQTFDGADVAVHVFGNLPDLGSWLTYGGVAVGARRAHNYEALTEVTVRNVRRIGSADDGTIREQVEEITGRTGPYQTASIGFFDADFLVQVGNSPLALRGLWRSVLNGGDAFVGTSLGFDVSVFRNDAITGRIAGLVVQFDDVFDQRSEPASFKEKLEISFVVNLPLASQP
jgi:hypothetical protein